MCPPCSCCCTGLFLSLEFMSRRRSAPPSAVQPTKRQQPVPSNNQPTKRRRVQQLAEACGRYKVAQLAQAPSSSSDGSENHSSASPDHAQGPDSSSRHGAGTSVLLPASATAAGAASSTEASSETATESSSGASAHHKASRPQAGPQIPHRHAHSSGPSSSAPSSSGSTSSGSTRAGDRQDDSDSSFALPSEASGLGEPLASSSDQAEEPEATLVMRLAPVRYAIPCAQCDCDQLRAKPCLPGRSLGCCFFGLQHTMQAGLHSRCGQQLHHRSGTEDASANHLCAVHLPAMHIVRE